VGEWGSLGYLGLKLRYPVMYFLSCIFLCTLYWSTGWLGVYFVCVYFGDGDLLCDRRWGFYGV